MNSRDLCQNNVLPSLYTNLFPEHQFGEETVKKVHTAELLGRKEKRNLMLQDTSCPPPALEGLQGPEGLQGQKKDGFLLLDTEQTVSEIFVLPWRLKFRDLTLGLLYMPTQRSISQNKPAELVKFVRSPGTRDAPPVLRGAPGTCLPLNMDPVMPCKRLVHFCE